MKTILLIILLMAGFTGWGQNIIDTIGQQKTTNDTTIIITYKIYHTYILLKNDIVNRIYELQWDSANLVEDKRLIIQDHNYRMSLINQEKRRLQKLLK